MKIYTLNEWKRCENLHSKRVEKIVKNCTPNGWRRCKTTLETSGEDYQFQKSANVLESGLQRAKSTLKTSEEDLKKKNLESREILPWKPSLSSSTSSMENVFLRLHEEIFSFR